MAQNSHILLQLCPLTHLNTPAHPVSEASLLSAGGTDHLHYATAPWFPRPTSQWRMIVGAYSSVSCSLVNSSMKSAMCLSPGSHCGQIWALTFLRDSLHCISKLVKKQEMISKNSWKTEANRYLSEKKNGIHAFRGNYVCRKIYREISDIFASKQTTFSSIFQQIF